MAYNTFDLDRLMSLLHLEIEFENISRRKVNIKTVGQKEFRAIAEQSRELFKSRKQTITHCDLSQDETSVNLDFEAVL